MIKKLKRKLTAVVVGVAAVILLVVFAVLFISTETGARRQSRELLQMALEQDGRREGAAPADYKFTPEGRLQRENGKPAEIQERSLCFTAMVGPDGAVDLDSRAAVLLDGFSEGEIEALAREIAADQGEEGSLSSYRLRWAKRETADGMRVAFADTSQEYASLSRLLRNSLMVGVAALLVVFLAAVLLARWAVRPVETAWNQQKQFVGDASHELKTPLTVILSNADMILSHPEEDPARWAENIKAEGRRMKSLTRDLLTLARSDGDAPQPVLETVDFSYLATDCVLSFEPTAFETGHEMVSSIAPGISLRGDPAGLSQLCGVLLDNALKYASPGGQVRVTLEAAGKAARLSVSNQGEPIPPQDLSRIFERFYRGDPSRQGEGHGLGLSIARRVAELHKGRLWAESADGWNTFVLTLPCEKQK